MWRDNHHLAPGSQHKRADHHHDDGEQKEQTLSVESLAKR